jgi:hypothetical protein
LPDIRVRACHIRADRTDRTPAGIKRQPRTPPTRPPKARQRRTKAKRQHPDPARLREAADAAPAALRHPLRRHSCHLRRKKRHRHPTQANEDRADAHNAGPLRWAVNPPG